MANALVRLAQRIGLMPTVTGEPAPFGPQTRSSDGITFGVGGSSVDTGWTVVNGNVGSEFMGRGQEVRRLGFERHPIVQACVRCIADIVATVDFQVYTKDAGGDETVLDTAPALMLLHSPRVGMNRQRLRALTAVHYLLYGNVFWILERDTPQGLPKSIRLVHPEHIFATYIEPESQEILVYEWRDRMGGVHKTLATDVMHFKDLAAGDWLFGFPRAAAALIDISADYEAGQFVRQIVMNDGTPSIAIMLDGPVTKAELEAGEQRWHEKMTRRGGRGRTAMLAGVKDVKKFSFNMRDMEFTSLRAIAREDICAVFGVDPRMIAVASARGTEGGLSGVQYREARFRLIQQTIMPVMGAIEAVLDDWFMPEFGDQYVRFDPDSLSELTENEDETSTRTIAQLEAGLITREEGRQRLNMPDEMEPKDTLVGSVQRQEYMVEQQFDHTQGNEFNAPKSGDLDPKSPPAPGDAAPAKTPDSSTSQDPGTSPARAVNPPEAALNPSRINSNGRSPADPSLTPTRFVRRGLALSSAQRATLWTEFDQRATKQEGAMKRAAVALFHAEKSKVHALIEHTRRVRLSHTPREGRSEDPYVDAALRRIAADYAPGGDYHTAWLDRYRSLIGQTVRTGGDDLAATIGVDFQLENPLVQEAIESRATALATFVGETTSEQITAAVAAGRAAGMSMSDIADMIDEGVFGGGSAMRAERIARTETVGAMNQGEYLSAKLSGVIQSAEWLTEGDDLVRESHAEIDGERVDLGDTFSNGLLFPGDQNGPPEEVINCRCTMLYHDEDASS